MLSLALLHSVLTQVVALSRLVYRKGIDLMALVIPYICAMHPNVDFIVGKFALTSYGMLYCFNNLLGR